jgi:hypothetical protein
MEIKSYQIELVSVVKEGNDSFNVRFQVKNEKGMYVGEFYVRLSQVELNNFGWGTYKLSIVDDAQ